MKTNPVTLSTTQAAKRLGVTERTIRNMITRGSIKAFKLDPFSRSHYVIPEKEVQKIEQRRKHE